jgi:hypothetical protein
VSDNETGERGVNYLGHELVSWPLSRAEVGGMPLDGVVVTTHDSRWVKANLHTYRLMAERAIAFDFDEAHRIHALIARKVTTTRTRGRRWTSEELLLTWDVADAFKRQGLRDDEIAQELGMSRSTLHRARVRARLLKRE